MNKPILNVPNILKVRAAILSNTQAFDMNDFINSDHVEQEAYDEDKELTGHDIVDQLFREPDCGTTACIAGWATTLAHHESPEAYPVPSAMQPWFFSRQGADYLGLDLGSALELFYAAKWNDDGDTLTQWSLAKITAEEAAETLQRLADTGEVDWSHLSQEPRSLEVDKFLVFGTHQLIELGLFPDPEAKV